MQPLCRPAHRRRSHVNNIICVADHIEIVLDDKHRRPIVHECLKDTEQRLYVQRVQSDGRLIKMNTESDCPPPISLASF